jgi:hypothetical protein
MPKHWPSRHLLQVSSNSSWTLLALRSESLGTTRFWTARQVTTPSYTEYPVSRISYRVAEATSSATTPFLALTCRLSSAIGSPTAPGLCVDNGDSFFVVITLAAGQQDR